MGRPHFVYSFFIDGRLCCFHLLVIMKMAAVNMRVLVLVWALVFHSLGYISRSGIVGSYGNSMFNLLRNHQTIFHNGWTILYPTSNIQGFEFLHLLACNCPLFFFFLIVAILVGWGCISPSFGKFYFWCNHGFLQGLCFLNFASQIYSLNFFPVTFSPTFKSLTHLESPFVFDVR